MLRWILIIVFMMANAATADDPKIMPEVQGIKLDQNIIDSIKKSIKKNPYTEQTRNRAQKSYKFTQSRDYQNKLEDLKTKILPGYKKNLGSDLEDDGTRLYLFISSSIPLFILNKYANQLEGIPGATMVMRGFIGGASKITPTLKYRNRLLAKNPNCTSEQCGLLKTNVIVDPNLFRRYKINRVPAVVTASGLTGIGKCSEGNTEVVKVKRSYVSFGDAPVVAHLKKMEESGDLTAKLYLQKFEKKHGQVR